MLLAKIIKAFMFITKNNKAFMFLHNVLNFSFNSQWPKTGHIKEKNVLLGMIGHILGVTLS